MNVEEKKKLAIRYNSAYRIGSPIVSDEEYDALLSELESEMGFIEFESFVETLTEAQGDVKLDFVVGSLKKIKAEEVDGLRDFLKKNPTDSLFVPEKLDGCSFIVQYIDGDMVFCSTRGDGDTGTDITKMAKKFMPKKDKKVNGWYRGELLLEGDSFEQLGYKNRRNGASGIVNSKTPSEEQLKSIVPYFYQILDSKKSIKDQFEDLDSLGFKIPFWVEFSTEIPIEDLNKALIDHLTQLKANSDHDIDGLVISSPNWKNENDEFYPKGRVAFKLNSEGTLVEVLDIVWETSRTGALKPVVLIEPTQIDGAKVSRVSGYNARFIDQNKITPGMKVKVIRSGEVIPKIIGVEHEKGKIKMAGPFLTYCPSCGTELKMEEVDLKCENEKCPMRMNKKIVQFLKNMEIEGASEKTIENLGIQTIKDLCDFRATPGRKIEEKLQSQIEDKIMNCDHQTLFSRMQFDGSGEKTLRSILDSIQGDFKEVDVLRIDISNIERVTKKTLSKISSDWYNNIDDLHIISSDPRYKGSSIQIQKDINTSTGKLSGKKFLITGTLNRKRKDVEKDITDNGGTIASGVSKDLDFLIVGEDAGSKLDKAKKLGVKILSETDLLGMI